MKLARQNLNEIIRKVLPLVRAEASGSHKIIGVDLGEIPDLMLDEGETIQLIYNMVRNGLEAMEPNRSMVIKTECENDRVALIFKDEGRGIPPEIIDTVGTPFFTTKENGTGLGLSVCYNIIEHHNASMKFDTSPNGTTFYIYY